MLEVFVAFLKLGLTSFGGPIAHVGYFHRELVVRRAWVDDSQFAQLLAVSHFLPGPASSQLGFSLGLIRAGWMGALAAFVAFTLPSALLLFAFAQLMPRLDSPYGNGAMHGLKLVAVAVVAQGVLSMAQRLTPDWPRRAIAITAAIVVIASNTSAMQLAVVAVAAIVGVVVCRKVSMSNETTFKVRYGNRSGAILLTLFGVLLVLALLPNTDAPLLASVGKAFYRAGALVFGGAHVVLPLLEEAVVHPGWISRDEFLAGYGAAQAVPGPMFSVAAFLGARIEAGEFSAVAAGLSVLSIFLPGLLLVAGVLPLWRSITRYEGAMSALAGINAAVVGLLAAALYDPVWTSAVFGPSDFVIALIGFMMLAAMRLSVLLVLCWCLGASLARVWFAA
jgi:chromate transporter